MKTCLLKFQKSILLGISLCILLMVTSCNEDESGGVSIANEIALSGAAEQAVVEGDGNSEVTVTYGFAIAARAAGSVSISATTTDLSYGVNYTTTPAESNGVINVSFEEGAETVSFSVSIIDDQENLPDGSVTFALTGVEGENTDIPTSGASFTLSIQDNEGESISATAEATAELGEVVAGTNSAAQEITFSTINVVSDISATTSGDFEVSDALDGTYGSTATLAATATSVFVRASPNAAVANGLLSGTVTLTAGDASEEISVQAIVSSTVGMLFWAENFDYPIDDTYPAYSDEYPANYGAESATNWGIVPVSARYRLTGNYNGSDASVEVTNGLERAGNLDTWYTVNRLRAVSMGDGPLSVSGYPGSGIGRTARVALDYGNQSQRGNCNNEGAFLSKNTVLARRFAENGSEITSGNVYFSAMIKVNEVFDESTPVLKNAIMMVTGDASYVGANAMKLNIQNDGAGGFNFGVSKSGDDGSVIYGANSYSIGETYAVIVKVEIKEDNEGDDPNDAVSVYVFSEGDAIPSFEEETLTAEAIIDDSNQDITDVHDVTSGLELFYVREVADVFGAGGVDNVRVHDVEFSGIRIATSWTALVAEASTAQYDNTPTDALQTMMYGQPDCPIGPSEKIGNRDK